MEKNLPTDPVMLLSVVNTRLRDFYSDLTSFCEAHQITEKDLMDKLAVIDYVYDKESNQFV